jgi:hypothetical protein
MVNLRRAALFPLYAASLVIFALMALPNGIALKILKWQLSTVFWVQKLWVRIKM